MGKKAAAVEEGPLTPWFVDGVAWLGMADFDDRVLAWLQSVPDGANSITRDADGESVPFIVTWLWNSPDAKGSLPGWEFKTIGAARKRFISEVAKAGA